MSENSRSTKSGEEHTEELTESPEERSTLALLWRRSWSYLFKGILVSLALHLVIMALIFLSPTPDADLDVDWMGRFGTLSGIGHGAEEFDQMQEVDWDELADFEADQEAGEEDEPEEEVEEDEPEEVPEEVDEQEEPREESPESEERQAAAEPEEEPESGPGPGPQEEAEEAEESEESEEVEPEPAPRRQVEGVPGVDRSSPSNLPDLRNYGPGNARMTALVRLDRLRGTAIESHANTLIRAIPDYRILLDGTNFDAINELDALFMASADPTHLHETFLAVRHGFETEELQTLLDNRFADPVKWELDGERPIRPLVPDTGRYRDPRRLLLASPGLALVGKPEWFEELIGPVDPDSDLGRELADSEEGPTAFQLIDGLAKIEEVADREDMVILISAYGLIFFAPGVGRLPRFEAVRLSLTNPANPKLTIDLRFATSALARDFARDCPRMQRQIIGGIPLARALGIASLVERLDCSHDDDYVTVTGTYTERELSNALQIAAPFIPRPPALTGLPKGPDPNLEPDLDSIPSSDTSNDEADSENGAGSNDDGDSE